VIATDSFSTLEVLLNITYTSISADRLLIDFFNEEEGPFTVFAPPDDAFDQFPDPDYLQELLTPEFSAHRRRLLLFHVAAGALKSEDLSDGFEIDTLSSYNITVNIADGSLGLENGGQDLGTVVDPFDIELSNGVVHSVSDVLLPPWATSDLVDEAAKQPLFSTLLELVVLAGLEDTFRTEIVTVFGPVNSVFEALPDALVDYLRDNPDTVLREVLLYHAVPGILPAELFENGELTTLQGNTILLEKPAGGLQGTQINGDAVVMNFNGLAMNGIAHFISEVLIPPNITLPEL